MKYGQCITDARVLTVNKKKSKRRKTALEFLEIKHFKHELGKNVSC